MEKSKIRWLLLIVTLLQGCVIQSVNPFITQSEMLDLRQMKGKWVREGKKEQSGIKHWEFLGDKWVSYDDEGRKAKLNVKFKRIEGVLLMETSPTSPEEENISSFWGLHVHPTYLLSKIDYDEANLLIYPLNWEWFIEKIEGNEMGLKHVRTEGDSLLFLVSPQEWEEFLTHYIKKDKLFSKEPFIHLIKEESS